MAKRKVPGFTPGFAASPPPTQTAQAPAPTPGPAAPAPFVPTTQLPFNGAVESGINANNENLAATLAQITKLQAGAPGMFGYTQDFQVDANNPFGKASMLQRAYQNQKRGNNTTYASQGQLYSGALQNAQNDAQFNYQANDAALRQQLQSYLADLNTRSADAQRQSYLANSGLLGQWISSTIQNRNPIANADPMTVNQGYQPNQNLPEQWMNAFMASHGGMTPDQYAQGMQALAGVGQNPDVVAYLQYLNSLANGGK